MAGAQSSDAFLFQPEDEDTRYGKKRKEDTRTVVGAMVLLVVAFAAVCIGAWYATAIEDGGIVAATEEEIGTIDAALPGWDSEEPLPVGQDVVMTGPPRKTVRRLMQGSTSVKTSRNPFTAAASQMSLLCTVGSHAVVPAQYPSDGLCDLLFYAHVFYDEHRDLFTSVGNDKSFYLFTVKAGEAERTYHGMSFHAEYVGGVEAALKKGSGRKALSRLFQKNVQHYGVLNMIGGGRQLNATIRDKLAVLQTIKQLHRHRSPRTPDKKMYFAVGIQLNNEFWRLPTLLSSAVRAGAQVLVVRTHASRWKSWEQRATGGVQQPDINSTLSQLQALQFPTSILMMSFTMGVASFAVPENWETVTNRNIKRASTNFQIVDYKEVCALQNADGARVLPEGSLVSENKDKHYRFIYDDERTLTDRMKYAHRFLGLPRATYNFGWALFDVDHEDYDDACGDGKSFARLKAARRMAADHVLSSGKR